MKITSFATGLISFAVYGSVPNCHEWDPTFANGADFTDPFEYSFKIQPGYTYDHTSSGHEES